jgi:hypothetical protein
MRFSNLNRTGERMKRRVGRLTGTVAIVGALALGIVLGNARAAKARSSEGASHAASNMCKDPFALCLRDAECCDGYCPLFFCA